MHTVAFKLFVGVCVQLQENCKNRSLMKMIRLMHFLLLKVFAVPKACLSSV